MRREGESCQFRLYELSHDDYNKIVITNGDRNHSLHNNERRISKTMREQVKKPLLRIHL